MNFISQKFFPSNSLIFAVLLTPPLLRDNIYHSIVWETVSSNISCTLLYTKLESINLRSWKFSITCSKETNHNPNYQWKHQVWTYKNHYFKVNRTNLILYWNIYFELWTLFIPLSECYYCELETYFCVQFWLSRFKHLVSLIWN